jgi:hypothetical protein
MSTRRTFTAAVTATAIVGSLTLGLDVAAAAAEPKKDHTVDLRVATWHAPGAQGRARPAGTAQPGQGISTRDGVLGLLHGVLSRG